MLLIVQGATIYRKHVSVNILSVAAWSLSTCVPALKLLTANVVLTLDLIQSRFYLYLYVRSLNFSIKCL